MESSVTPDAYISALAPISAVGVVLWTGGLILLQKNASKTADSAHHLTNAAMACAAYGFLVPLLGLLANPTQTRIIGGVLGALYLGPTIWNVSNIFVGIMNRNISLLWSGIGYFAPTLCLLSLIFLPQASTIAWASGALIFISYLLLSEIARTPKA